MKNLIYKELKLSYAKFFFILPLLLGALMFIPNWIFVLVFMYFFWITAPQIFGGYQAQRDYDFSVILPVRKQDIVVSKALAMIILESLHLVFGLIFALIHNLIYGSPENLFFDLNPAFFGYIMLLFTVFNISFLPIYFKTAYHFGKPVIIGAITTFIFVALIELLNLFVAPINGFLESNNNLLQYGILLFSLLIAVLINYIAIKKSINNYGKII